MFILNLNFCLWVNIMKDRKLFISMMVLSTAQIGMTIYIPSLPFMSKDLNVHSNNISLIISIYLLS